MSTAKQEFRKMVEKQIENETKTAKLLRGLKEKTGNTVIRLLFYQLALDSSKHGYMLKSILQLLESPQEKFRHEGKEFRQIIENHVEIERNMLETFENIVDKTDDKRIRFIIQEIISDERKHHAIIKRIHELIYESERVKDEKWWDFLFRYSRLGG